MWRMLWLQLLLWPIAIGSAATCGSLELRQISDFEQLRNCSIVVGYVRIANLHLPANVNLTQLRSEVIDITDYLMVYGTTGLLSLEYIFPKLRLIRGKELLFGEYAVTVYQNRNLRELGLMELLRIQEGNIRIESNPMLCFVKTVNWTDLLSNTTKQHLHFKHNNAADHCPNCSVLTPNFSIFSKITTYCWNMKAAQVRFAPPRTEGCPAICGNNGCDTAGNCCHKSCLTGCSVNNCTLCANFVKGGRCVNECIASFELHKRECVLYRECQQRQLIPLKIGCMDKCPDYHRPVVESDGFLHCKHECNGMFHIKRKADLEPLRDCLTINGSLIIELVDVKEIIVSALEEVLGSVKEITGYLKVINSPQLLSLTFFRNLDTIRGDQLIENEYSLYVVNNHHMEEIWAFNRQVAIQRGTIFFHLNPRLCYEKILVLESSLKSVDKITIAAVSPNSNGERVICGDVVRSLLANIEEVNSTAARIVVDYIKFDEIDTIIGYFFYYKEAPQRNVTMYDGRHGCGHDNWVMDVVPNKNRRHVIVNLVPYTQYAVFVKTLTRTDYHTKVDAYSEILYFRTLPSRPSPVSRLDGTSDHDAGIEIYWWPPRRPNGVISKYVVDHELVNVTNPDDMNNDILMDRSVLNCACNNLEPYNSGPQPDDEDYYNKDQTIYEESLPNIIYVSRYQSKPKKEKFDRVKDFEDLMAIPWIAEPSPDELALNRVLSPDEVESYRKAEKTLELLHRHWEEKLRQTQDEDIDDFVIQQPQPKCKDLAEQLEQKCVVEEELKGKPLSASELTYKLTGLQPNQFYRISVRACVDGVINGCSMPAEIQMKATKKK